MTWRVHGTVSPPMAQMARLGETSDEEESTGREVGMCTGGLVGRVRSLIVARHAAAPTTAA